MFRRHFLTIPAVPLGLTAATAGLPAYRVVTPYAALRNPNPHPGRVISAPMEESQASVKNALAAAMKALTKQKSAEAAWSSMFEPADIVGIKVNCSGAPKIMSHPLVVGEIVRNLVASGVKPQNIFIFERFGNQVVDAAYSTVLPDGVQQHTPEPGNRGPRLKYYDPLVYVDVDFFGEEETRSFMTKLVSRRLTKIINVPNMKDHGASGVTGCLKNIAYGCFSNVARSHRSEKTNTLSLIGTLFSTEPLRSKTVLHVMDGIKGVWHGGPFVQDDRYLFYPKRLLLGTDPISIDRLLIDIIDNKRREEGAVSVWNRSMEYVSPQPDRRNPNQNAFIREPGHIEYAAGFGLGVYDKTKIQVEEVRA